MMDVENQIHEYVQHFDVSSVGAIDEGAGSDSECSVVLSDGVPHTDNTNRGVSLSYSADLPNVVLQPTEKQIFSSKDAGDEFISL